MNTQWFLLNENASDAGKEQTHQRIDRRYFNVYVYQSLIRQLQDQLLLLEVIDRISKILVFEHSLCLLAVQNRQTNQRTAKGR